MNVYIDIQTRSLIDLSRMGVEKYTRHPSFEILAMVIKFNEEYIIYFNDKFQPDSIDSSCTEFLSSDETYIANNYTDDFDHMIDIIKDFNEMEEVKFIAHWNRLEILGLSKFIPELDHRKWICTAQLADRKYLPSKLAELSRHLKLRSSLPNPMKWINAYCIPNVRRCFNYRTIPRKDILEILNYSKFQVSLCEEVYNKIGV